MIILLIHFILIPREQLPTYSIYIYIQFCKAPLWIKNLIPFLNKMAALVEPALYLSSVSKIHTRRAWRSQGRRHECSPVPHNMQLSLCYKLFAVSDRGFFSFADVNYAFQENHFPFGMISSVHHESIDSEAEYKLQI